MTCSTLLCDSAITDLSVTLHLVSSAAYHTDWSKENVWEYCCTTFMENSLGHPMLTSIAATSFSLHANIQIYTHEKLWNEKMMGNAHTHHQYVKRAHSASHCSAVKHCRMLNIFHRCPVPISLTADAHFGARLGVFFYWTRCFENNVPFSKHLVQ